MIAASAATPCAYRRLNAPRGIGPACSTALGLLVASVALLGLSGCGTTKSFTATEQLLVSDAVDSTVSKIDFRPLSGRRVFLDNSFFPSQKGVPNPNPSLVHSEYVTSSLRQQMLAAGVLVCEKREEADIIVEARMGALGFDGHSVTYGIPASSSLSTAASTISGAPMIPLLPELSFAKKEAKSGAAKLALFAYERQSLQPVWQSGIARSTSSARDTWLLGIGPLQYGTIYEGTRFAGSRVLGKSVSKLVEHEDDEPESLVDYKRSQVFTKLEGGEPDVKTATNQSDPPGSASSVTQAAASAQAKPPAAATATPTPAAISTAAAAAAAPSSSAATATAAGTAAAHTTPAASSAAGPSTVSPPISAGAPAGSTPLRSASTAMHIDDRAKN